MRAYSLFERGMLMDPISAISGGVGLISNIAGGIIGSGAAKKAAAGQVAAANAAGQKVQSAVVDANDVTTKGAANASDMALRAAGHVEDTAATAAGNATTAANTANGLLNPYSQTGQTATGQLNAGLAAGGDFNKMPTLADLQMDPGYAFRLQQGQLAQQNGAAAHGGALGGNAAVALNNYAQGAASQEYQNAFNRFETATQNRFSNLTSAANQGINAGTTMGHNLTDAAQYGGNALMAGANANLGANEFAGGTTYDAAKSAAANTIGGAKTAADYLTGGANAAAAGTVGAANAWNGALGGVANTAQSVAAMNLFKNPATNTYVPPAIDPTRER